MTTAAGVDESLPDPHLQELEDAIQWCIERRALIRFYHDGAVLITYDDVKLQSGPSLLEAIALANGEEVYREDS